MNKSFKKLLSVILCAVILFTTASVAFAVNAVRSFSDSESIMLTSVPKNISDTIGFCFMLSAYVIETVLMFPILVGGIVLSLFGVKV
ncbi:MAG: hypothetical protein IJN38_11140 [Clostridia bacterium]|nr:hypothetical protein [Clostridia bacterium]